MTGGIDRAEAKSHDGVPVDAHVHFYHLDRVPSTLDSAAANFRDRTPENGNLTGLLLLTQSAREQVFEALTENPAVGAWSITACPSEPQTRIARKAGDAIAIICGRQIRCDDGLEVAALGTTDTFPDGLTLAETVARVRASGACPALPWGFGKWTGRRGKEVRRMLDTASPDDVAVTDNGGRLRVLGRPALIDYADRAGFKILPGTDPFPNDTDYRRVGGFGFLAGMAPDPAAPWTALRAWLREESSMPVPYGRGVGIIRFVRNQVGIRIHNARQRSSTA